MHVRIYVKGFSFSPFITLTYSSDLPGQELTMVLCGLTRATELRAAPTSLAPATETEFQLPKRG